MFRLLKIFIFCILLIFVLYPFDTRAQKSKKRKNTSENTISSIERELSVQFADGIREYYSYNYVKAEEIFRNIIISNPKSDPSYFLLSKIKWDQKQYNEAIEYLKKAIEIDPANIWYSVDLASLYDIIEDYNNSVVVWEKVCKKITNNEYYLYELSRAYLKLERYEDLIKTYDKMEEIVGFNEELTETKKSIWLYLNNIEKAVAEYERFIPMFPYDVNNYITIGEIYLANNQTDKAIDYFKKAEEISPDQFEVLLSLYEYYSQINNLEKRNFYFLKMIQSKESSNDFLPIFEKELKEIKKNKDKGKITLAIAYCNNIIEKEPNNVKIWSELVQLNILVENNENALIAAKKAIENKDFSYETWDSYISILFKIQDYESISKLESQIRELFPTQSYLLYILATSLHRAKQYDKSIEISNQAITYAFDDYIISVLYEQIGDSYLALNNKLEALKNWQKSVSKGNKSSAIKEKMDSLK